nr:tRNA uridine-5-carboxymethylaminomethyl(34) synthesis GTPase MnmE [Clostridia bacterium]
MSEKTIAAISTPPAAGGIGIIRISGVDAVRVADAVFRSVSGRKIDEMRPWTCALGHIADGDETIDECIATLFRAPRSYTGEDVVELSCHGGTYVTRRVLRAVLANGAEPAGPGEFTKRAYLNGRIDLSKAEAVMNIISARGEAALRGAVSALGGAVGRKIDEITASLVNASAAIAVWTDDPDEDVPAAHEDNLERVLRAAADGLSVLIRDYDNGRAVNEGVDTVICGSPNVGKSTLMNLLSGYDRSIVADMPGTTRDVVEDTVLVGDVLLRLADTAGIREDAGEIEALGVSRTVQRMDGASLLIAVFDGSQPLTREDV